MKTTMLNLKDLPKDFHIDIMDDVSNNNYNFKGSHTIKSLCTDVDMPKKIYFETGYNDDEEYTNIFVLSANDALRIGNELIRLATEINKFESCASNLFYQQQMLKNFIELDLVDYIDVKLHRVDPYKNNFSSTPFPNHVFNIHPHFKKIEGKDLSKIKHFNFNQILELHVQDSAYMDSLLKTFSCGNDDIKVRFRGYVKQRKKDQDDYQKWVHNTMENFINANKTFNQSSDVTSPITSSDGSEFNNEMYSDVMETINGMIIDGILGEK